VASAAGIVTSTRYEYSNGEITVTHGDGWQTKYAHMSRIAVTLDQSVASGRLPGYVDDIGNATREHLHYEQDLDGVRVQPRFDGTRYEFGDGGQQHELQRHDTPETHRTPCRLLDRHEDQAQRHRSGPRHLNRERRLERGTEIGPPALDGRGCLRPHIRTDESIGTYLDVCGDPGTGRLAGRHGDLR